MEVRELLSRYEFPGDDIPIVQVSALKALEGDAEWEGKILELMEAVDTYIPEPTRDVDKPFLMPIEDVFTITEIGRASCRERVLIAVWSADFKQKYAFHAVYHP